MNIFIRTIIGVGVGLLIGLVFLPAIKEIKSERPPFLATSTPDIKMEIVKEKVPIQPEVRSSSWAVREIPIASSTPKLKMYVNNNFEEEKAQSYIKNLDILRTYERIF